jgi:hypothetical protein
MKNDKKKGKKKDSTPADGYPAPKSGGERKANWKEYMATVEDIQNFLMDKVLLRHNVITRRVEYRFPEKDFWDDVECRAHHSSDTWQPITDRVVNSLWAELSATKVVRDHRGRFF